MLRMNLKMSVPRESESFYQEVVFGDTVLGDPFPDTDRLLHRRGSSE